MPCEHAKLPPITGSPIDGLRWGKPTRYTPPGFRIVIVQSPPRCDISFAGELSSDSVPDWTQLGIDLTVDRCVISNFRYLDGEEEPALNREWKIKEVLVEHIVLCIGDEGEDCRARWPNEEGTADFRVVTPIIERQRINPRSADGSLTPWSMRKIFYGLESQTRALLITQATTFSFATCYDLRGQECFGKHPCYCHPPPPLDVERCPGIIAHGNWGDCFRYNGWGWGLDLTCRLKEDSGDYRVTPSPSTIYGRELEQMCSTRVSSGAGCTNNWAVANYGHVKNESGCFPNPLQYYVEGAQFGGQTLWDTMDINWGSRDRPRLLVPQAGMLEPAEIVRIKAANAAIEFMQSAQFGDTRFDRVDHPLPQGTNVNSKLDLWSRQWFAADTTEFVEVPGPNGQPYFDKSYLVKSGCKVPTKLMIRSVSVSISLVFHRFVDASRDTDEHYDDNCWISARMKIELECYPRVEAEDPKCLEEHGLEIIHTPSGRPVVEGDQVRYVDYEGNDSAFPWLPIWQGGRSQLIFDKWANVYHDIGGGSGVFDESCTIACGMNRGGGYGIGPLPTRRRDFGNEQIRQRPVLTFDTYAGRINLKVTKAHFRKGSMCDC